MKHVKGCSCFVKVCKQTISLFLLKMVHDNSFLLTAISPHINDTFFQNELDSELKYQQDINLLRIYQCDFVMFFKVTVSSMYIKWM